MAGQSHRHYRRVNKSIKRTTHHKVKPFLKGGTWRVCEGRKVGALDSSYLAADFSRGYNLVRNGDFENDEFNHGFPDDWTISVTGQHPTYTQLATAASATNASIHVTDPSPIENTFKSNVSIPIVFEPIYVENQTDDLTNQYPYISNSAAEETGAKNHRHKRREVTWITPGWDGNAAMVPLSQPLVYYHDIGAYIKQAFCVLDDRLGVVNTQSGLSAFSGDKSCYLDVPNNTATTTIISSWFPVRGGELYYAAFVAMRAFTGAAGFPSDPPAYSGLKVRIEWDCRADGVHFHQDLIPHLYKPSDIEWEYFETIVQCPLNPSYNANNDVFKNHTRWGKNCNRARIHFINYKMAGSPVWIDDVRVIDMGVHKWEHGFYNPGASDFSLGNSKHNPVFLPKRNHAHIVPVCDYPEATGNINCQVYVEDNPRDVGSATTIAAHAHVAGNLASVGITYSVADPVGVLIQPQDYFTVRICGQSCTGLHSESACRVQLLHSVLIGGGWTHTLVGQTSVSSNLSGTNQGYYHEIRIKHDPNDSSYGGTFGSITAYAFGSSFAGCASTFRYGVPGIMGGDGGGSTKVEGLPCAGLVKDYTVSTNY